MRRSLRSAWASLILMPLALAVAGCGSPNKSNIELRKRVQELTDQVESLKKGKSADQRVIAGLRQSRPTVPTLSSERLEKLFTTHGLRFGRLTGGADTDRTKPGDDGIKVYVVPTDAAIQPIKAAGAFTFDVFDLADPGDPHLGTWTFDVEQSKRYWNASLFDYTYAFPLPWQKPPRHAELTVRVTFLDELTQTPFAAQTTVKVHVAPATMPSTSATTNLPTTSASPAQAP